MLYSVLESLCRHCMSSCYSVFDIMVVLSDIIGHMLPL